MATFRQGISILSGCTQIRDHCRFNSCLPTKSNNQRKGNDVKTERSITLRWKGHEFDTCVVQDVVKGSRPSQYEPQTEPDEVSYMITSVSLASFLDGVDRLQLLIDLAGGQDELDSAIAEAFSNEDGIADLKHN